MRLDKYLKVSRLVKRRTLAKEISDQGRVTINGNVAKALSLIHISEPTRLHKVSRMPSSA